MSAPSSTPPLPRGHDLARRVVIVTGAGTGIGAAVARQLASRLARVVLVGRRRDLLDDVAAEVTDLGGAAHVVRADLADATAPRRVIAETVETFGAIDALVNNAAVIRNLPVGDWDFDTFDAHIATNVRAPFFLIASSLAHLEASPIRSVVNVTSSSGIMRRAGQSVYGMTKCALDYLTQSLAGELAERGIRINAVAPGPTDTPIHETWSDDLIEAHRWLRSQVPLGRIAAPAEIARWVVLLLGPESSYVTGTVIPVDGGQVIDRA